MTIKPLKSRTMYTHVGEESPRSTELGETNIAATQRVHIRIPQLPVELICCVLSHLEHRDLLQCTLVSKLFYKLVNETSRLMYTLELAKSRMVSILSPEDKLNFAHRLELLKDREQAWRVLAWKHRRTLDLPPTGSLYEFVGGVYGNGREGDNRMTTSISFLELPSLGIPSRTEDITAPQELKLWTHLMPDLNIIDFTMDPIQDLLVLVAVAPLESQYVYELHIRSIKTNQAHPKAPTSVFPCLRKPLNHASPVEVITAVRVQVCGNLVALLIKDVMENSGGHLEIWNWEHGPQYSCQMPRTNGIDDFSFLTNSVALIVRPTGQFEVYDFADPGTQSSEPVLRYAFAFPPLSPGYSYWYISMSNNPTPGCIPSPHDHQRNLDGFLKGHKQIYYPNPEDRVHACCLYVFNPADPVLHAVSSFVFFVKIGTLLNPPIEWFVRRPFDDEDAEPPYCRPDILRERMKHMDPGWEEAYEAEMEERRKRKKSKKAKGKQRMDEDEISSVVGEYGGSDGAEILQYPEPGDGWIPIDIDGSEVQELADPPSDLDIPVHGFLTGDEHPATHIGTAGPSTSAPSIANPDDASSSNAPIDSDSSDAGSSIRSIRVVPLPWETWGPMNTRWFDECLSTDWQHAIYGLRAVESVEISKLTAERQIEVHKWAKGRSAEDEEEFGNANGAEASGSGSASASSSHAAAAGGANGGGSTASGAQAQDGGGGTGGGGPAPAPPPPPPRRERRFLRIRDFNPYAQTKAARLETKDHAIFKGKGRIRSVWRTPKVVTETSRVEMNGVFKYDIMSSLPYVETVSDETFDVTDVMMDDSRLLLLKVRRRGRGGQLKTLEVLMV